LNRHIREVHDNTKKTYLKHIKKDRRVVCAVCEQEFTHSASLKKHIISKHSQQDLIEKKINKELVFASPFRKTKPAG
jgi:DNA repair exonuclease SbcCD ATPase subunit